MTSFALKQEGGVVSATPKSPLLCSHQSAFFFSLCTRLDEGSC